MPIEVSDSLCCHKQLCVLADSVKSASNQHEISVVQSQLDSAKVPANQLLTAIRTIAGHMKKMHQRDQKAIAMKKGKVADDLKKAEAEVERQLEKEETRMRDAEGTSVLFSLPLSERCSMDAAPTTEGMAYHPGSLPCVKPWAVQECTEFRDALTKGKLAATIPRWEQQYPSARSCKKVGYTMAPIGADMGLPEVWSFFCSHLQDMVASSKPT